MSGFSIQLSSLANVYDEVSEPEESALGNYDDIAIMHICDICASAMMTYDQSTGSAGPGGEHARGDHDSSDKRW